MCKRNECIKFYYVAKHVHLEIDISRTGLGAKLLQVNNDMNCRNDSGRKG